MDWASINMYVVSEVKVSLSLVKSYGGKEL